MEIIGQINGIARELDGELLFTFKVKDGLDAVNFFNQLKGQDLTIKVTKYRQRRSKDANAMLWACLEEIAQLIHSDKWTVYLQMLKRYGKFTYICVKPNAVEAVQQAWRECEIVGEYEVNGQKAIQMLCYFGSSTYNSQEFSRLLEGVISEMRELGIQPPPSDEMKELIRVWEEEHQ